jgi:creatinine amidohydrolase/Fe(II)-dependent formamide hydrolase-like protein
MRVITALGVLAFFAAVGPAAAQVENPPSLPTPTSVFLEDLTWVELRDAIAAGKTTVIIPTGGTEQNGPIMVLGKHNFLVRYKAGEIAKQLGNAIVAPVMAYVPEGDIPGAKPAGGHMRFPGTITTPEDAYQKVLEYAARSLRSSGFLDIAMIGDSGGNQNGQKAVSEMLNKEWAATNVRVHHISDYYPGRGDAIAVANGISKEAVGSHAGSQDTTSLMYINPGMLRFDKFTVGKANDGQGHVGDPKAATAAIGKLILEAQIQDAAKQIQSLRVSSRGK